MSAAFHNMVAGAAMTLNVRDSFLDVTLAIGHPYAQGSDTEAEGWLSKVVEALLRAAGGALEVVPHTRKDVTTGRGDQQMHWHGVALKKVDSTAEHKIDKGWLSGALSKFRQLHPTFKRAAMLTDNFDIKIGTAAPIRKGDIVHMRDGSEWVALEDAHSVSSGGSSPIPGWGDSYGFKARSLPEGSTMGDEFITTADEIKSVIRNGRKVRVRWASSQNDASMSVTDPLDIRLAAFDTYPAVIREIENDYRRGAITRGERSDLKFEVEDAETEREAREIVRRHQNMRSRSASDPFDIRLSSDDVDEKGARHEKGKSVDPTKDMSPEDAAEWKAQNDKNKDKFKSAAGDEKDAKFEKGKPADPTAKMSPEQKAEWEKQNKANRDKFKKKSHGSLVIPGDAKTLLIEGNAPIMVRFKDKMNWPIGGLKGDPVQGGRREVVQALAAAPHIRFVIDNEGPLGRGTHDAKRWKSVAKSASGDEKGAMFTKGKPADPTKNMTPEQKAEWEKQKDEHKDKFKSAGRPGLTKFQPNAPRPGPYIEMTGKPGLWKVIKWNPHKSEPVVGTRTIGQIAWGTVQKVTKAGKPTGKQFNAHFDDTGNKMSVNWKGKSFLGTVYKEVRDLPKKGKKAAKPDTPEQAKVWAAWDALLGVEKVKGYASAHGTASSYGQSAAIEDDGAVVKQGKKIETAAKALDKQSRSWRSAYNLWREGKSTDFQRMASDLDATHSQVTKLKTLLGKKTVPDLEGERTKALAAADVVLSKLKAAAKAVKGAKTAADRTAIDELALMELALVETGIDGVPMERSLQALERIVADDALSRAANSQVGKIIHEQMGGRRLNMMLGIYYLQYLPNGMEFGFPNKTRSKGNHVKITLKGDDTYTVEFLNTKWLRAGRSRVPVESKKVKTVNGVYADMLGETFEKQTGWYVRMASDATVAALEELHTIEASFDEGARIPDGWDNGHIDDADDDTPEPSGSKTPDGSGNLDKRATDKEAAGIELWVAVTKDGKFLGAQEGSHASQRGGWRGVTRTQGQDFEIQRAVSIPMNMAETMTDWGSNNPRTNFWKDEATAFSAVKRYISKGKQANSAHGGLYGHTKKVQADCETCVRKLQRDAGRIARSTYAKNEKVAAFIKTHADRSDSLPAKILMAAMESMGPKFAAEMQRTARLTELREARGLTAAASIVIFRPVSDGIEYFHYPMRLTSRDTAGTDGFNHATQNLGWDSSMVSTSSPGDNRPAGRKGVINHEVDWKTGRRTGVQAMSGSGGKLAKLREARGVEAYETPDSGRIQWFRTMGEAERAAEHMQKKDRRREYVAIPDSGTGAHIQINQNGRQVAYVMEGQMYRAASSRSQMENAIAGKFPPDSKKGRGKSRTVMLTGDVAKVLGKSDYTNVKLSELSDGDLDKLYTKVTGKKASDVTAAPRVEAAVQLSPKLIKEWEYDARTTGHDLPDDAAWLEMAMDSAEEAGFRGRRQQEVAQALLNLVGEGSGHRMAAPRGKAQKALATYVSGWKSGTSETLTDIARHASFKGIHFAKVLSAAEALKKAKAIGFDGVTVKKAKTSLVGATDRQVQLLKLFFAPKNINQTQDLSDEDWDTTRDELAGSSWVKIDSRGMAKLTNFGKQNLWSDASMSEGWGTGGSRARLPKGLYAKTTDADAQTGEGIKQTTDKSAGYVDQWRVQNPSPDWRRGDVGKYQKLRGAYFEAASGCSAAKGLKYKLLQMWETFEEKAGRTASTDKKAAANVEQVFKKFPSKFRRKSKGGNHEVHWMDGKWTVLEDLPDADLKKMWTALSWEIGKTAGEDKEATARGLYGFSDKVASLGLNACSEMRGSAGRIAFDLHRRRSAKHENITSFLDTHCKTAKCMHSRLLAASYPSADTKVAAVEAPRTVEAWLSWED